MQADLFWNARQGASATPLTAFTLRSCERCDHVSERAEVDALPSLDGLDAECSCKVALACSRRSEEVDGLVALDEAELSKREDAIPVERRLEGEVEAGQGLDGGQLAHPQRRLDTAVLAQRQFLRQQDIDRFQGRQLSVLETSHGKRCSQTTAFAMGFSA